ncbi:MAG: DUF4177 domain-containing protein [Defluviitaleaceae bacterium]|nr:DUF4177 domain-containing protein [Defluviitaleaceae bacterium]MCL2263833.1 DUF4177 domain-containing protein [Defluviitaleaceae bacterium]
MYEYKTEILRTGTKWGSDKANDADVSNFNNVFNERAEAGWELVTYDYMSTSTSIHGALLVTYKKKKP